MILADWVQKQQFENQDISWKWVGNNFFHHSTRKNSVTQLGVNYGNLPYSLLATVWENSWWFHIFTLQAGDQNHLNRLLGIPHSKTKSVT